MDIKISPVFNSKNSFGWHTVNENAAIGYLFDQNDQLYEGQQIIDYFMDIFDERGFKKKLMQANGAFSVVIKKGNMIYTAVNIIRSHPLFYSLTFEWIGNDRINLVTEKKVEKIWKLI